MEKKLQVEGMTCQNCVKRVKKIIDKNEGTSEVSVILENKEAIFTCEPSVDVSAIVNAINDFGFSAAEKN
jgi:copper chaperone CopZ